MLSVSFDLLVQRLRCFFARWEATRSNPSDSWFFRHWIQWEPIQKNSVVKQFLLLIILDPNRLFRGREDGNKWCLLRMELRFQIINTRVKIDSFMLTKIPKSHWSVISPEWICAQMTPVSPNGPTDEMLEHPSISYLYT